MPARAVLVDTGPLAALLNRTDQHHAACVKTLQQLDNPLYTVWPVVTEAMYLLSFSGQAQEALLDFFTREAIRLAPLTADDLPRIRDLLRKYRDLPMDLADAALVAVAERDGYEAIFTLDQRDFRIYAPAHAPAFTLLPSPRGL